MTTYVDARTLLKEQERQRNRHVEEGLLLHALNTSSPRSTGRFSAALMSFFNRFQNDAEPRRHHQPLCRAEGAA